MPRDKGDELLREQRRRQAELIELKKRQQGLEESAEETVAIADSNGASVNSKWKNFWYYNWKKIIAILLIGILATVLISQCSAKKNPDVTVVLYCEAYISTDSVLLIQQEIAKYCDDFNKDGEINVRVANCAANGTDKYSQEGTSKSTQLLAQFQSEEAIMYIVDEESYEKLLGIVENGFIDCSLGLPDKNGCAYKLSGTDFMYVLDYTSEITSNKLDYSGKTFYAFCRATDNGTLISGKKGVESYADRAHDVISRMIETYSAANT